jgi:hypothetical protein
LRLLLLERYIDHYIADRLHVCAGYCRTEQYQKAIDMFIGVEVLETELHAALAKTSNIPVSKHKGSKPPQRSRDREQRIGWPVYNEVYTVYYVYTMYILLLCIYDCMYIHCTMYY